MALDQLSDMIRARLRGPIDAEPVRDEIPAYCRATLMLDKLEKNLERNANFKQGLPSVAMMRDEMEAMAVGGTPTKKFKGEKSRTYSDSDSKLQSLRDQLLNELWTVDPEQARMVADAGKKTKRPREEESYSGKGEYQHKKTYRGGDIGKGGDVGKGGKRRKGEKGQKGRKGEKGGIGDGKGGSKGGAEFVAPGSLAKDIVVDEVNKTWTFPGGRKVNYEREGRHVDEYTEKCGRVVLCGEPFPKALAFCDCPESDGHSRWSRAKHQFSREDRSKWQQLFARA
jgi:hypothetical protein